MRYEKDKHIIRYEKTYKYALSSFVGALLLASAFYGGIRYNSATSTEEYPTHHVTATEFWAGEPSDASNKYIDNKSSAWVQHWQQEFGGIDDPQHRCGWDPCSFTPQENTFYFALPFDDLQKNGQPKPASTLEKIPWYPGQPAPDGQSLVKNHWIVITNQEGKTAYAQWEDVGPMNSNDTKYVFGDQPPKYYAGLDLSPAVTDYLNLNGKEAVSWHFAGGNDIPAGPWKTTITASGVSF
jgi:hypothetical protein